MPFSEDALPPVAAGPTISFVHLARAPATSSAQALARIQQMAQVPGSQDAFAVLDTNGLVSLLKGDAFRETPVVDLRGTDLGFVSFGNESGLRSVALHPDFATEGADGYGRIYLAYSATLDSAPEDTKIFAYDDTGNDFGRDLPPVFHDVVTEFTVTDAADPVIDPTTARELFRIEQPFTNHNFGSLQFNPDALPGDDDYGLMYFTTGDGGGGNDPLNASQELDEILGKLLRIDPLKPGGAAYGVPDDNPFVGVADALPEILAYGFRNPQQISFDTQGRIFLGEIGQNTIEEIDVYVPGGNYGWDLREGTFVTAPVGLVDDLPADDSRLGFQYPWTQYDHEEVPLGGEAVAGGYAYRGSEIGVLKGSYIFADLPSGDLFSVSLAGLDAALADGRISPDETIAPRRIQLVDEDGTPVTFGEIAGRDAPATPRVDLRFAETSDGEILAFSKTNGDIFKLVAQPGETRIGTIGNDLLEGTPRDDILRGLRGQDTLLGRPGDDVLSGGVRRDILLGGLGDDTLRGGDQNDVLRGQRGADVLSGGKGNDDLFGGKGLDTADYSGSGIGFGAVGVRVNLRKGETIQAGGAVDKGYTDRLDSIENVIGTSGNDTFRGRGNANLFDGGTEIDGPSIYSTQGDVVELFGTADEWVFSGGAERFEATGRSGKADTLIDIEYVRYLGDGSVVAVVDLDFI